MRNSEEILRGFWMRRTLFALLVAVSTNTISLDFFYSSRISTGEFAGMANELTIRGKIESGDTRKFIAFLREKPKDAVMGLYTVALDSPGGNVIEAMKLAQALKEHYPDTVVRGACISACVLLWLAGGVHFLPTEEHKLGVHRPYFEPKQFAKLSIRDAETQYAVLAEEFRAYVLNQGLPQSIYEKLNSTSSDSVYWLTIQDLILIGGSSPAYEERFKSACGNLQSDAKRQCRLKMILPERVKAWQKVMAHSDK